MTTKTLTRPTSGRMLGGVCAGLADHYGWSRGKIRLLFVLAGLFGAGELVYIVLWVLMPKRR